MTVIAIVGIGAILGMSGMPLVDQTPVQDRPPAPDDRAELPRPPDRALPSTSANQTDTDGDMLADGFERDWYSNPGDVDTDNDGVNDSVEYSHGGWPEAADFDEDGLTDRQEIELGTDPQYSDTDRDRLSDGEEVNAANRLPGSDPLHKDLYVVIAYSQTNEEGLSESEKQTLKSRFADMRVRNPDNTTGIRLHYVTDTPAAGVHDFEFTWNGSKAHFNEAYRKVFTKVEERNRDDYHVVFYPDFSIESATMGKGLSTTPGHFAIVTFSAGDRPHVTHHELMHQIVGIPPEDLRCDHSPMHTCRGLLSHNGETWLSWELIERLETDGFAA